MAEFFLQIQNKKGLHARAAALFVKAIERYHAEVWVMLKGQKVSGRSIMGLMMLAAGQGTVLTVEVEDGPEAEAIQTALTTLANDKFNEEE